MNFNLTNIPNILKNGFIALLFLVFGLVSCTENPDSPGVEYMPDMYRATGYEAYLKKYDIDSADFFKRNLPN